MASKLRPTARALSVALAALVMLVAWRLPVVADGRAMVLATDRDRLTVETRSGERAFSIEIAASPSERERGLMFRETMPEDHGMLFVFEDQRQVGFWMKNTVMPLDLVFISEDGKVQAVLPGEPFSEAVITPGVPVRFVLELKAGTAAADHIAAGDEAHHPAISRAAAK
jgi:uncharacterized membrane protein (UPF0127 family)